MTKIEELIGVLAMMAVAYRGPAHLDTDVVVTVAGLDITVGNLKTAYEHYFGEPFRFEWGGGSPWMTGSSKRLSRLAAELARLNACDLYRVPERELHDARHLARGHVPLNAAHGHV
jgi:hypothetical protein